MSPCTASAASAPSSSPGSARCPRANDRAGTRRRSGSARTGGCTPARLAGPMRALDPESLAVQPHVRRAAGLFVDIHVAITRAMLVAGGARGLVAFDLRSGASAGRPICGADRSVPLAGGARRRTGSTAAELRRDRGARPRQRRPHRRGPQPATRQGRRPLTWRGRELVAFGAQAGVVSRWRLDGSGLVTRMMAAGQVTADAYDATGARCWWPAGRRRRRAMTSRVALWDPAAIEPLTALPPIAGMGWIAPDTLSRAPGRAARAYLAAASGRFTGSSRHRGHERRSCPRPTARASTPCCRRDRVDLRRRDAAADRADDPGRRDAQGGVGDAR